MMTTEERREIPDRVLNFGSDTPKPEVEESFDEKDYERLPKPTGYRVMILPFKVKERTRGGIILADSAREREQLATVVGLVLKLGPDAYKDLDKYPEGPWCKEKDWVVFGRYAGARIPIEGGEIRLLNDDEILAVVYDPEYVLNKF
jgi:chaperonin GroES